jgi:hypothetical protein
LQQQHLFCKKRIIKSGTQKLTPTGQKRQSLGAAGRAKDRAAQKAGGKSSEYKYNHNQSRTIEKKILSGDQLWQL